MQGELSQEHAMMMMELMGFLPGDFCRGSFAGEANYSLII